MATPLFRVTSCTEIPLFGLIVNRRRPAWLESAGRFGWRSAPAELVATSGDRGNDAVVDQQIGASDERAIAAHRNAAAVPISSGVPTRPAAEARIIR
jgi:hypothetical protein